jgi:hypothetical protein
VRGWNFHALEFETKKVPVIGEMKMHLFMMVSFWCGVLGFIIRIFELGCREWPHTKTTTLGGKVAETLLGLIIIVWAGIVLWL